MAARGYALAAAQACGRGIPDASINTVIPATSHPIGGYLRRSSSVTLIGILLAAVECPAQFWSTPCSTEEDFETIQTNMGTPKINPLKKRTLEGAIYTRRPEVEAEIDQLLELPDADILARCGIRRAGLPGHISSEAALHMLRARRAEPETAIASRLFSMLAERVLRSRGGSDPQSVSSFSGEQIRERVYDRFVDHLLADRKAYDDRLDYFEINFNAAVARLRQTAQKQVWRDENRSTTLVVSDEDGGEIKSEVERTLGDYDPLSAQAIDDARYRSRLDAAIDALPPLQSRIVEMLRKGIPIDSNDPSVVTIRGALEKAEKTIRNQRDKAYARLRVLLAGKGEA